MGTSSPWARPRGSLIARPPEVVPLCMSLCGFPIDGAVCLEQELGRLHGRLCSAVWQPGGGGIFPGVQAAPPRLRPMGVDMHVFFSWPLPCPVCRHAWLHPPPTHGAPAARPTAYGRGASVPSRPPLLRGPGGWQQPAVTLGSVGPPRRGRVGGSGRDARPEGTGVPWRRHKKKERGRSAPPDTHSSHIQWHPTPPRQQPSPPCSHPPKHCMYNPPPRP